MAKKLTPKELVPLVACLLVANKLRKVIYRRNRRFTKWKAKIKA